jgi:signal transduction histidine kinase
VHAPPESDAVEQYRRFKRRLAARVPPFVVFAETGAEGAAIEAMNAGVDGYVRAEAPGDAERLHDRIRATVDQREAEVWRLRRRHDRLETFRSVVSHDLRTPLSAAKGYLELMQSGTVDDDEELLGRVVDSLDRLERYLTDLDTLEEAGTPVEETEAIKIADVAKTTWDRTQTGSAVVDIRGDGCVSADRGRLVEAFYNVYRNAVEHGGDDVTVSVGKLAAGFYIEDDGAGITRVEYSDLFEPGFSTTDGATGLGLAIVDQIAAAHRWDVSASEGPNGGVRITFDRVKAPPESSKKDSS